MALIEGKPGRCDNFPRDKNVSSHEETYLHKAVTPWLQAVVMRHTISPP
jgi:hypothetical protein